MNSTSTGLNPHLAGLLCYIPLGGLILFLLEKKHQLIRFHGAQSTLFFILLFMFNQALIILKETAYRIGWGLGLKVSYLLWWVFWAEFFFCLALLYKGYKLEKFKLPWVAEAAERLSAVGI